MSTPIHSCGLLTLVVGQMATNCYILFDSRFRKAVVIDPGEDDEYIASTLARESLTLSMILLTHAHFDHILAAYSLEVRFGVSTHMHKLDNFLLKRMQSSTEYFLGFKPPDLPPQNINYYDGNAILLGDCRIDVLETPGHTPGSVSLYIRKEQMLFCGDLLFARGVVGRTDFVYSNIDDLHKSLHLVLGLPSNIVVYPGHGESTTIGEERRFHSVL